MSKASQDHDSYLVKSQRAQSNYDSFAQVDEKVKGKKDLKMNYDDILQELGELGLWQIIHLSLLWLPSAASGIFVLTYSFTGLVFCLYLNFFVKFAFQEY